LNSIESMEPAPVVTEEDKERALALDSIVAALQYVRDAAESLKNKNLDIAAYTKSPGYDFYCGKVLAFGELMLICDSAIEQTKRRIGGDK